MIVASGHRKLVTHIFAAGDQYLDSDVVFGVKKSLVEKYRAHRGGKAPDGRVLALKAAPKAGLSAEARERFLREAETCRALDHPHHVPAQARARL